MCVTDIGKVAIYSSACDFNILYLFIASYLTLFSG